MTFVIPPSIHDELKGKAPDEFFEGIEAHVCAGMHIPLYRYYHDCNPWEGCYKDKRKNPLVPRDQRGTGDMGKEITLAPGQLAGFREEERCRPWARRQE